MERAFARLGLPDGRSVTVTPGTIVGRLVTAGCRVADPRVSEAHALVSLRGRGLHLLSLRGELRLDGHPVDTVALATGQRVELAEGLALTVGQVEVPVSVLAVQVDDGPAVELSSAVYSLVAGRLVVGYVPGAAAWVWSDGEAWSLSVGDAEASAASRLPAGGGGPRHPRPRC